MTAKVPSELDAVAAFAVALAIAAALTPLTNRLARLLGAIDQPRARGLSNRETPRLGGLAIFVAAAVAGSLWLDNIRPRVGGQAVGWNWGGLLAAAALVTLVGALDDRFDLHPALKLLGQIGAAIIAVAVGGLDVHFITLPVAGRLDFPNAGPTLTAIGLVGMMNVVNFSDGVDGLAAGLCAIISIAFAVIAFTLAVDQHYGGVLAAITAGAAIGFLFHNFPPASSFMGDAGANLLGLLLGAVAVEGDLKTSAIVTLALPLIMLAVPFLDTTFVVLKRLKYRRPLYLADTEHLHHRMARIGFSARATVLLFYGWTLLLAGYAVALRFIPYSNHHGHLYAGGTILAVGLGLVVLAASLYLVYVLEIFRGVHLGHLPKLRPDRGEGDSPAQAEEVAIGDARAGGEAAE